MKYTENYHLPNWAKTDRIQMETFNDMTAKLDTALNEHKLAITTKAEQRDLTALNTKVSKCGNCRIYMGTYVGTDTSGVDGPTTYPFPSRPLLFVVFRPTGNYPMVAGGDLTAGVVINGSAPLHMKCEGSTVSWYGSSSTGQFNDSRSTYVVIALLAADE